MQLAEGFDRLTTITSFADQDDVSVILDDCRYALSENGMVVNGENFDRHHRASPHATVGGAFATANRSPERRQRAREFSILAQSQLPAGSIFPSARRFSRRVPACLAYPSGRVCRRPR